MHLATGFVFFLILWLLIPEVKITMIFIPIAMVLFPDTDLKFNTHRNFLFHSVIIWVIVWIYNPSLINALVVLSIGLHCLCDIRLSPKYWKGFYNIKLYRRSLLKGLTSTLWLAINFIISVIVFLLAL